MHARTTIALLAACSSLAAAQSTVNWTTTAWADFGTTDVTGASGNFLPGWTTINATPDLGDDVFFIPNQSLSGVDDDAALWFNQYDPSQPAAGANEVARLSLSGFTPGQTYSLNFFATLLRSSPSGWSGNNDSLDVAITGADISDWDSTTLSDAGDADGMNIWLAQSLSFIAVSGTVEFDFGGNPSGPAIGNNTTRIGIDGFELRLVPAPGSTALVAGAGLLATRRRR